MKARMLIALLALAACRQDPAQLVPSLVDPASASPQYFHGNCFAGFSVQAELRLRETQGIEVGLSRLAYRVIDRGTGRVLADEALDTRALEERFGASASVVPAGASKNYPLSAISTDRPAGPLAIQGEVAGMDESEEAVMASFDLSASLVVSDPGPPSGGACSIP